jgi:hypothetical protein
MAGALNKPTTTIFDLQSPSTPSALAKERHPLPPAHYDAAQFADTGSIAKAFYDLHEIVRKATLPTRTDPSVGPTYIKGVSFTRPTTAAANVAVAVTATVRHNLGASPTVLHSTMAMGDPAYHPVMVANPNGLDPAKFSTVSVTLPAGSSSVTHDLKLGGA